MYVSETLIHPYAGRSRILRIQRKARKTAQELQAREAQERRFFQITPHASLYLGARASLSGGCVEQRFQFKLREKTEVPRNLRLSLFVHWIWTIAAGLVPLQIHDVSSLESPTPS